MQEHWFTKSIIDILSKNFWKNNFRKIFNDSVLIQYINEKTRSANKWSKARWSFANLYAIYVLVEDYIKKWYDKSWNYSKYEWAMFSNLFKRQRELPFWNKLQNHALNNRMNSEFVKFFPNCTYSPIIRDQSTNRYWINENLLIVKINKKTINLARSIIEIIDEYVKTKQASFLNFIEICSTIKNWKMNIQEKKNFVISLLSPNVDARLFEIVSYSILKFFYIDQRIFWWFNINSLKEESLSLYKTWRTNANDGWIDFVMKPLWRFFQVTETLDFKKYFLDIDKIERYPLTFVIKTEDSEKCIMCKIKENAKNLYGIDVIVKKYMKCIEEIINIPKLVSIFEDSVKKWFLDKILSEIEIQSKIEFNFNEESDENDLLFGDD